MAETYYQHIATARGISIILVALGHAALLPDNSLADNTLGVVRMPFFFLLAGLFCSFLGPVSVQLQRKSAALLKPYFFILLLLGLKQWTEGADAGMYLSGMLYANGQTIPWTPLWFLPHLFLLYILAIPVFRWYQQTTLSLGCKLLIVSSQLLLGSVLLQLLQPVFNNAEYHLLQSGLPWGLDFLLISFGFFSLGYLCRSWILQLRLSYPLLVISLLLLLLLVAVSDAQLDLNLRQYQPYWGLPLLSVLGCLMLLQFSLLCSRIPVLAQLLALCGRYSLYILIFHVFIQMKLEPKLPASISLLLSIVLPVLAGMVIRHVQWLRIWFEPAERRKQVAR